MPRESKDTAEQCRSHHSARLKNAVIAMAVLALCAANGKAQTPATAPGQPPPPTSPAPSSAAEPSKPAEYVGSEVCQACHEDIFNAFLRNPHHVVEQDANY